MPYATATDVPDELETAIRQHVRRIYDKCEHNLTRAAKALNVARTPSSFPKPF